MRILAFALSCALAMLAACKRTSTPEDTPAAPSPRLVVLVVVDQLRGDELERHRSLFRYGLHRLMTQGRWYTHALHGHARTETAAGHASISTGLYPREHGVVDKRIWDDAHGRVMGVCDYGEPPCDAEVLRVPTLGDRLKEKIPTAKVAAVAQKSRSAMLLGGKQADLVAWARPWDENPPWMDGRHRAGATIVKGIPDWLDRHWEQVASPQRVSRIWERPRLPPSYETWADAGPGEADCGHGTTFPHKLSDTANLRDLYWAWLATPDSDRALVETVLKVAARMDMGTDDVPDLLLVSFSGFDAIGHNFGPDSVERVASLVHLDRQLGDLLDGLTAAVGRSVVVGLTADHGVAPLVDVACAAGHDSKRVDPDHIAQAVDAALDAKFGPADYVRALAPPFIKLADELPAPRAEVVAAAHRALDALPEVQRVISTASFTPGNDPMDALLQRSISPGRSGDLMLILPPYQTFLSRYRGALGAEHGSPYDYDRHVPVLLWGDGVERAQVDQAVEVISLTNTLSLRLGVGPIPGGAPPLP